LIGTTGAAAIAVAAFIAIAMLDYVTGYEIRLPVLYLLPIALATWTRGRAMGHLVVGSAVLCWLVSLHATTIIPASSTFSGKARR
jgi:hypothetical protein